MQFAKSEYGLTVITAAAWFMPEVFWQHAAQKTNEQTHQHMKSLFALLALMALVATGCDTIGNDPSAEAPVTQPTWPPPSPNTINNPPPSTVPSAPPTLPMPGTPP
jgi:hypothetical protein